jgi:glycosyltransferase involved in cell wall biosynthesis
MCWQLGGAQRPGVAEYLESLKSRIEELGLADRILFPGQRADVEKLLAAADVYCQPNTDGEPFGIAFIEALYAGLPVITSDIGGALEIVDKTCGLLVPAQDAQALRNALSLLIQDKTLREDLGSAGPARSRQLCHPPTQMRRLEELLSSVVQQEVLA